MRYFGRHHNSGLFRKTLASESRDHPLHQQLPGLGRNARQPVQPLSFAFAIGACLDGPKEPAVRSARCLSVVLSLFVVCVLSGRSQGASPAYAAGSDGSKSSPIANTDVVIPGPMRSFMRMAGISQKARPGGGSPPPRSHGGCSGIRYWRASAGVPDPGDSLCSTSSGVDDSGISRWRTSSLQV